MTNGYNKDNVDRAAMVLRSLRNEVREKILHLIEVHEGIRVTELYKQLNLEQSVASQHLRVLRDSGIVKTKRSGKSIHYSLDYENNAKISELANSLAQFQSTVKSVEV